MILSNSINRILTGLTAITMEFLMIATLLTQLAMIATTIPFLMSVISSEMIATTTPFRMIVIFFLGIAITMTYLMNAILY
jgi:hypothetical protein